MRKQEKKKRGKQGGSRSEKKGDRRGLRVIGIEVNQAKMGGGKKRGRGEARGGNQLSRKKKKVGGKKTNWPNVQKKEIGREMQG